MYSIIETKNDNSNLIIQLKNYINLLENDLDNLDNNKFKIINYKKALNFILNYNKKILSSSELKDIKCFGPSIINRIENILLKENQNNNENENKNHTSEINKLKEITGIGPSIAKKLYEKNVTFDKLQHEIKNNVNISDSSYIKFLNHHQLIGLKYDDSFKEKIPREEIKILQSLIKKILSQISEKLSFTICGSFRRKSLESGDIDLLVTNSDYKSKIDLENSNINYLKMIIDEFTKKNIIIDNLTSSGKTKYMGVCKINNIPRRLDIRFVPYNSYIPSILYFTGSWQHNIGLRNIAIKQNYKLNEYGLYKFSDDGGEKEVLLKSEKDLYDILGLEYILPKDR